MRFEKLLEKSVGVVWNALEGKWIWVGRFLSGFLTPLFEKKEEFYVPLIL